jgi:prepilin-type N-terminal cleavage/methylation domain-containing protein
MLKPRQQAFTLIEVVVALTILSMMTGTLFAIIQGSVRAASQIEQIQRENDAINRLLEVLRKTFTTLPSTATLTLSLPDGAGSDRQELLIVGAPNCFSFGPNPISFSDTTLTTRPSLLGKTDSEGNALQDLAISRSDLIPQTTDNRMAIGQELDGVLAQDEQGRHWMPLLPEVQTLKWRFYELQEDLWHEEWERNTWPSLIEIQLLMKDRLTPIRMVFSVPVINITRGSGSNTAPTTGAPPTSGAPPTGGAPPAGGGPPGMSGAGGGQPPTSRGGPPR